MSTLASHAAGPLICYGERVEEHLGGELDIYPLGTASASLPGMDPNICLTHVGFVHPKYAVGVAVEWSFNSTGELQSWVFGNGRQPT